jgi:hypothetical protein
MRSRPFSVLVLHRTTLLASLALASGCAAQVVDDPRTDDDNADDVPAETDSLQQAAFARPPVARAIDPSHPEEANEGTSPFAAASPNDLTYGGGPLITKAKIVAVFWGSNVNSTVTAQIGGFYSTMVNHPYVDWLSEYSVSGKNIGRGTFGGSFTITPGKTSTSLTDGDIATELASQMAKGNIPLSNSNTIYMVHFPKGITISAFGQTSCVAGGFCAYHFFAKKKVNLTTRTFFYGVMPDFSAGSGCDTVCGADTMFQNFTSTASHEVIEAITDPTPFNGWNGANGEISDVCNQQHATIRGTDGTAFTVQRNWSNTGQACIFRRDTNWGFAWSNQLTGTFTPPSDFSRNSSGGADGAGVTNTVTNTGTGHYRVDFPNIGEAIGGNVQVVAYGSGSEYCNVANWQSSRTKLQANIDCFNSSGSAANSLFATNYVRYSEPTPTTIPALGAYVWANNQSQSHTPDPTYQWNSARATNTVRRNSTGNYDVIMPGVADGSRGGDVIVSAYGSNARCKVASWGGSPDIDANVLCFAPSGSPVDSRFTLRYGTFSTVQARSSAFAWFDQATSASFTPDSFYQSGFVGGDGGAIGSITAGRNAKGSYFLRIPTLTPTQSTAMISGYGSGSEYCKVVGWFGSGSGTEVDVACFDRSGRAADARFVASYANVDFLIK